MNIIADCQTIDKVFFRRLTCYAPAAGASEDGTKWTNACNSEFYPEEDSSIDPLYVALRGKPWTGYGLLPGRRPARRCPFYQSTGPEDQVRMSLRYCSDGEIL